MRKKVFFCIPLFLTFCFLLCSCGQSLSSISDKLIRFHVIANSDSDEDQAVKLKVRDRILKEFGPMLEASKSKAESEKIINENLDFIKTLAQKELKANDQKYSVSVILGKSLFPTKSYSNLTLPAGEYDALRVVLGKGEGKNWWCVMFPPLCFVDITRGVTSNDTEARMKTVLDDEEYSEIAEKKDDGKKEVVKKPIISDKTSNKTADTESVTAAKETKSAEQADKIEIRFKSVEIIKSVFAKIKSFFAKLEYKNERA